MIDVSAGLARIQERMSAAAVRAGRKPEEIELVAVSKTHPAETVREAVEAGQNLFGENRVQELLAKVPLLPASLRWHLIGHLQSNKIRKVLPVCELIHGVDSLGLAEDIDRVAAELGLFPRVLLEVNVSGEESKFGFSPDVLEREMERLAVLPRIQVEGLMTVAPLVEKPEDARPVFARLRELRDRLATAARTPLPALSMGMTGDFEIAVEEGATLVRIGTAIFGGRSRPGV